MIPIVHMNTNTARSFGLIAFSNMIIDGRLNVVTAIIKAKTAPSSAPFESRASATGIVPKISPYIGMPTKVARMTPNGLLSPISDSIQDSGIQLWMIAPIPTPTRI